MTYLIPHITCGDDAVTVIRTNNPVKLLQYQKQRNLLGLYRLVLFPENGIASPNPLNYAHFVERVRSGIYVVNDPGLLSAFATSARLGIECKYVEFDEDTDSPKITAITTTVRYASNQS